MIHDLEQHYPCVGICMADPDSGYCLGCGRPPLTSPDIVHEQVTPIPDQRPPGDDPDTPS